MAKVKRITGGEKSNLIHFKMSKFLTQIELKNKRLLIPIELKS